MPSYDSKKEKLKDIVFSLHWAATTGNVGLVKFALDQGVPIDSVVNGFVPLQLACINDNNIAVVQYLIDRGANVNIQKWSKKYTADKNEAVQGATGSTALHVACANGCIRIVDLLLRNNARVNIKDKYGSTPLDIAYAKNETDIIRLLQTAKKHTADDEPKKPFVKTHKRSYSDKQPRTRRPSLPSIDENSHPPSSFAASMIHMTPVSPRITFTSSTHRPPLEDTQTHSCPDTPRPSSSIDLRLNTRPPSVPYITNDASTGPVDWYGYGVVTAYEDENYLVSLERRAFNLSANAQGRLERRSHEHKRRTSSLSEKSNEDSLPGFEEDVDDDDTSSESLPRPSMTSDTVPFGSPAKRNWFAELGKDVVVETRTRRSFDLRPNLDTLTQFAKRSREDDPSSDDNEKQQKSGFISRWTSVWSRK